MKNLLQYRLNGPASILLILLAVNAVIAFSTVGFFLALVQAAFSFGIAFLGNKAEIWKEQ